MGYERVVNYYKNYAKYKALKEHYTKLLETPQIKLSPLNPSEGEGFVLVLNREELEPLLTELLEKLNIDLVKFEANFKKWDQDIHEESEPEPDLGPDR